jgi:hypothetical protein
MYNLSSGEGPTFAAYAKEMTEHIQSLGPSPLDKKYQHKQTTRKGGDHVR